MPMSTLRIRYFACEVKILVYTICVFRDITGTGVFMVDLFTI